MPSTSIWKSWLPAPIRRLAGVRARIWAVFLAGATVTLAAAVLAIAAFGSASRQADHIAAVSVPILQRVADAVEQANQLAALAPSQMSANSEAELATLLEQGQQVSKALQQTVATLPRPDYQRQLSVYIESLDSNLESMNRVTRARLTLRDQINADVDEASRITDALRIVLSPIGAAMNNDSTRARQLYALQEIKIEIHLLHSLITRVGFEPDRLRVAKETNAAQDALDRIDLRLTEMPSGGIRDVVIKAVTQLQALMFGEQNVPLQQMQRLEARQQADDLLESNRSQMNALRRLQRAIQADTASDVAASTAAMSRAFNWARTALIALALFAVAGALLLGWLFAGPLLGNRLVALAHGVEDMAGGKLDTAIADKGNDEIGRLAEALRQFQGLARERARIENELSRLANFDALTSLPNRHLLHQRANDLIEHSARAGQRFAVLFVDLDRFKPVNDSQGHEVGDLVLHEAAGRLQHSVRRTDMLGRLGGDEFVLLMEMSHNISDAELVAEKIIEVLREPFRVGEKNFFIGASIGISRYPDDGHDFAELLRKADAAMYNAKALGGNSTAIYREEMNVAVSKRLEMESALRHALDTGELEVWYQPKAQLQDGRISGAEALIRWRRDGKLISPAEFIPLAEETGLIVPIGAYVLRQAAVDAVHWRAIAGDRFSVAVNLSSRQLIHPEQLVLAVEEALQNSGLPAAALELEVTESLLMQNLSAASLLLEDLRHKGHRIAVDDFGTGYASLSYVKNLPIDILKIDQTFVRGLPTDAGDIAVASALLGLGKALNFVMVAEGVETVEQRDYLRERGCQIMQGYYLSKPLPAAQFEQWLQGQQSAAA
ncbi:EAL domain-containing protein [Permianibacter sp. IMCC34836]|uniref:putative bifunctional diguanylate cyclase/phosphodiesterase n=1 Tax=Permianibacter fluminis TaxID=2738515 RepID=UPI001553BB28|nr:EAL domain-containing protein [Permianibacter fluminis]NQD36541.1 EAL domain-containing protein [Permianibacter fluminis]